MKRIVESLYDFLFTIVLILLVCPGAPFVIILSFFKRFGDGSGNELEMIERFQWAAGFGVIFWILVGVIFYRWLFA